MKKLIFLLSLFVFLTFTGKAHADLPGFPVDPPPNATIVDYVDPNSGETWQIATWPGGWECTNGNSVIEPPPPPPPEAPPPYEPPGYEPPGFEPPPYEPPVGNPTATPPVCNKSCNSDAQCPQQCPVCAPGGAGNSGKSCQAKPTSTPTPTATPSPTTTPKPSATPTATPTPTPTYSDDMCKCDGVEVGNLGIGQESSITAYGKVTGDDNLYAKLPSITFVMYKTTNGNNADIISQSQPIPTELTVNTQALKRYKAVWKFNLDPALDATATYRIQAKLNCQKNTASIPLAKVPSKSNVLAAETSSNIFSNIASFLFGTSEKSTQTQNPTPTPKASFKDDQIKLGTFYPSEVLEKTCTFVKFSFQ